MAGNVRIALLLEVTGAGAPNEARVPCRVVPPDRLAVRDNGLCRCSTAAATLRVRFAAAVTAAMATSASPFTSFTSFASFASFTSFAAVVRSLTAGAARFGRTSVGRIGGGGESRCRRFGVTTTRLGPGCRLGCLRRFGRGRVEVWIGFCRGGLRGGRSARARRAPATARTTILAHALKNCGESKRGGSNRRVAVRLYKE